MVGGVVAALALAGTAAVALTGGGDGDQSRDPKDAASARTTKTTAPSDPDRTTSTSDGDGGTNGSPNSSQITRATGAPAAPTTPYFAVLRTPPSVSCAGKAPTDRIDVGVSWTAVNANSVTVALDSPDQIWESGLPTEGSTAYTVPCDGSRTVTTVIVTARGLGDTGKTERVTIPIAF